ncbi:HDOD domain-containing protein [candidate division KSB1 bacterium]|nr:HDOD domain-containing protein [candidate division KSB1 bacterium]
MLTFEFASEDEVNLGNVLVVDDEVVILKYLTKSLSLADITVFAAKSGAEAIEILKTEAIDIVIADFRMPGMNGLELLAHVKENYANISRILLSGYIEQAAVLKALTSGVALTYFSKPWDDEVLIKRLKHILEIQKIFKRKDLLKLLNTIDTLPNLPTLYQEFINAIENEKPMNEISEIIKKNASVATKVLQVANSAFYGLKETASIDYAMVYIGINPVKDIVLTMSLTSEMQWDDRQTRLLQDIFDHSSLVNRYIPKFYSLLPDSIKYKPFPAVGITHDIGKIILLQYYTERYLNIIRYQNDHPHFSFYDCELAMGYEYISHAEIGAYFLDWWNLPEMIMEVALFHHCPERASDSYRDLVEMASFTDRLVNYMNFCKNDDEPDLSYFDHPHISPEMISNIASAIKEDIHERYNNRR